MTSFVVDPIAEPICEAVLYASSLDVPAGPALSDDDLLTAASASLYARVKAFSDDLVRRGYMVSYRLSESGLRADIEVRLAHEVAGPPATTVRDLA